MPRLEIRHGSELIDSVPLQPDLVLLIGRSVSCDIRLESDRVDPVHGRIVFSKNAHRLVTLGTSKVIHNGESTTSAELLVGDVIRIGPYELVVTASSEAAPVVPRPETEEFTPLESDSLPPPSVANKSGIGTRDELLRDVPSDGDIPLRGDEPVRTARSELKPTASELGSVSNAIPSTARSEEEGVPLRTAAAASPALPELNVGESLFRPVPGYRGRETEPSRDSPKKKPASRGDSEPTDREHSRLPPVSEPDDSAADWVEIVDEPEPADAATDRAASHGTASRGGGRGGRSATEPAAPPSPSGSHPKAATVSKPVAPSRWFGASQRPGERDVVRSPMVLGLGIGLVVLFLAAGTLWYVIDREFTRRELATAYQARESGAHAEAVVKLEEFLNKHPYHSEKEAIRWAITRSNIEQFSNSAVPNWTKAYEAFDRGLKSYRDTREFQTADHEVRQYFVATSAAIAEGATQAAISLRQREPLAVTREALALFDVYRGDDENSLKRLEHIQGLQRSAERVCLRQEALQATTERVDGQLARDEFLAGLRALHDLLLQYPELADDKLVAERRAKGLGGLAAKVVKQDVKAEPTASVAATKEKPLELAAVPQLFLARNQRTRNDVPASGQTVFVTTEQSVVGLDTATGEVRWRRPTGPSRQFTTTFVESRVPSLLVFQGGTNTLALVELQSGQSQWETSLPAAATGTPTVLEGQIYLTTGASLLQIDLRDGHIAARFDFPQTLAPGLAVSANHARLFVLGDRMVLYQFRLRPLTCERVLDLGQVRQSVPPVVLRDYLLLARNDTSGQSKLHVFDISKPDAPWKPIATEPVAGLILSPPLVRGKQLFVASVPERVTLFTIAETGDEESLTKVSEAATNTTYDGPLFLTARGDDQLWMAGSAVRRLSVGDNRLQLDTRQFSPGVATQGIQGTGDSLFTARGFPGAVGVQLSEIDRQRMSVQWQTTLGARPLAVTEGTGAEGSVVTLLTELGDLFSVPTSRIASGGFEQTPVSRLTVAAEEGERLGARVQPDGTITVHTQGAQRPARAWVVGTGGNIRHEWSLADELDLPPVAFGKRFVLALDGRLALEPPSSGQPSVEEWRHTEARPKTGSAAAGESGEPASRSRTAPRWIDIVALDDTQFLALDEQGLLLRIELRVSPVPHLAEVSRYTAKVATRLPLVQRNGTVLLATEEGRVIPLDAATFEPGTPFSLPLPATQPLVAVANDLVLVPCGGKKLVALSGQTKLSTAWEMPLEGGVLAQFMRGGSAGETVWLPFRDGRLVEVVAASGAKGRTLQWGQELHGLREFSTGERIVFGADGVLMSLKKPREN